MNNDGNNATGRRLVCIVELFGSDANGRKMIAWGRKMIAWGRRIGCRDAGHGFGPTGSWYVRTQLVPFVPLVPTRANSCGLVPLCAVFCCI